MITILFIVFFVAILLLILKKLNYKKSNNKIILSLLNIQKYLQNHKIILSLLNIQKYLQNHKIIAYLFLAFLSMFLQLFVFTLGVIIIGNRFPIMNLSLLTGILFIHFIFGLIILKFDLLKKIIISFSLSPLIYYIFTLTWYLNLIQTNWDIYKFWDFMISQFIVGLFVWELFYQINKLLLYLWQVKNIE